MHQVFKDGMFIIKWADYRFLQCFVAFGVHDWAPVVSVMRAARTGLIDISLVLGAQVA